MNGVPVSGEADSLSDLLVNGQLPVGKYVYKVTVEDTVNYDKLEFSSEFYVHKVENRWVDVPTVLGWNQGSFDTELNLPVAKAAFGTVYYTFKDSSGNAINGLEKIKADDLDTKLLGGLGVGKYKLLVEVTGDDNFEGIQAEVDFGVFEDSVGMTALIIATMVFAAIAVGMAVMAILLLVKRNKMIDEEFRKFVNAEMRRK